MIVGSETDIELRTNRRSGPTQRASAFWQSGWRCCQWIRLVLIGGRESRQSCASLAPATRLQNFSPDGILEHIPIEREIGASFASLTFSSSSYLSRIGATPIAPGLEGSRQ